MPIHFHYCKKYKKNDAYNLVKDIVDGFLSNYQNADTLKGINRVSNFKGGIYIFRIKRSSIYKKIILQECIIETGASPITVYYIRDVLRDRLQDYLEVRDGKWLNYNPLPKEEEDEFLLYLSKQSIDYTEPKEEPPHDLISWHYDYKIKVSYDVYESEEWVKFAMNPSPEEGMREDEVKLYRLAIVEALKDKSEAKVISHENATFESCFAEVGVVYQKIYAQGINVYLLHNGANIVRDKEQWDKIRNVAKSYKPLNSLEEVAALGFKAYPSWAIKSESDTDLWKRIETNAETGNLSLLPEQTIFLQSFQFPKYINGQAGSGKSTMLYYLFANTYYYKYAGDINGKIIFLTENEKLLEYTKKAIYDLLLLNPEFEDLSSEVDAIVNLDQHFATLKDFLLEMLPPSQTSFEDGKYLSFPVFKNLYLSSNIPKHIKGKYSPELVWFTISTYVYGYFIDDVITSNNYDSKMPSAGKELVSKDDFEKIEQHVIPFYDKLLEDSGYWDKIKLIKYLHQQDAIKNRYEVIFCDESQDFSRVELAFILKLSSYTRYDLGTVSQFPVVFAGDALQTVNPTGFRKEELTSMLYKELQQHGFEVTQSLEFTPKFNYRSSQAIVNVANAIQFYRKAKFKVQIPAPQISKRPTIHDYEKLNVFLDFGTVNSTPELQKRLRGKTIIVPKDAEEIDDYISKNPILQQLLQYGATTNIKMRSVLTAVEAKGIDFKDVVVYGFGHEYETQDYGSLYANRFFFNKLYVAVTRAQSELIIIDSEKSRSDFWEPIINNYIASEWCKEHNIPLNSIGDVVVFDAKTITPSDIKDREADAYRLKDQGLLEASIPLLQLASRDFIHLGNKKEYLWCLGKIEEIKENWSKAVEHYKKIEDKVSSAELVMEAQWNGLLWQEILAYPPKSEKQKVRQIIAKIFNDNGRELELEGRELELEDLEFLKLRLSLLLKELNHVVWKIDFIYALMELYKLPSLDFKAVCVELLHEIDIKTSWEVVVDHYKKERRYTNAINALEEAGEESSSIYCELRLKQAERENDIQEIIIWSWKLGSTEKAEQEQYLKNIHRTYQENNNSDLTSFDLYALAYLYLTLILLNQKADEILPIAKKTEKAFIEQQRESELADLYSSTLKSSLLDIGIMPFVLERWFKFCSKLGWSVDTINQAYEEISRHSDKVTYTAYNEYEINTIPEEPQKINTDAPSIIRNITIKNFRQFEHIEVENLGQFNLVVGDNNTGKTSLLEAFLFTPNKAEYLKRLALAHIERSQLLPEKETSSNGIESYYTFYDGFDVLQKFKTVNANGSLFSFQIKDGRYSWIYEVNTDREPQQAGSLNSHLLQYDKDDFVLLEKLPYIENIKSPLIAYGKGYDSNLAQLYSTEIASDFDANEEFIERMKIAFLPSLRGIKADSNNDIFLFDRRFGSKQVPLHQYGEGTKKLFKTLLTLTLHKGQRVLIDEVDAGIHYTRFKKFWRVVLEIAKKDQTQIIATTHNEECMVYFEEVLQELGTAFQEESRIVQMKYVANELKAKAFEYDSLYLAIAQGVEMRGGDNG